MDKLDDFYVNVKDEDEGRRVQEIVFAAGGKWFDGQIEVLYPYALGLRLHNNRMTVNGKYSWADDEVTITYDDFVAKCGHFVCTGSKEEEYDG